MDQRLHRVATKKREISRGRPSRRWQDDIARNRDGDEGKSKSLKVCVCVMGEGGRGRRRPPVVSRGVAPGGVRGLRPLKLKAFSNLKVQKHIFLALYPASNSHLQNDFYCALRPSSKGRNQASAFFLSQDSILIT